MEHSSGTRAAPARRGQALRARLRGSDRVLLFVGSLLLYLASGMGRFNSSDGTDMLHTAESLLLHHSLAIAPNIGTQIGRGGLAYAKYGIGQSLAEMPLLAVDLALRPLALLPPYLFASMTNAWVTAAGVVLLYTLTRDLGYARRVALLLALVYAVATPAWPFAKLDFSEPLLTTTLLLCLLATLRAARGQGLRWAGVAGLALGAALLTKYAAVALAPIFAAALLLGMRRASTWRRRLAAQALFWLPVAIGGLGDLLVNWLRSGSPFITGYIAVERPFNASVPLALHAALALLVSPRYGLLVFATPVVLGALGFRAFVRRHPLPGATVAALCGVSLLVYATYPTWFAGWTWGPRFLLPIVPLLLLPAVEWLRQVDAGRALALRWVALAGVVEQLLGVVVNYRAPYELLPWARPPTAHVWEVATSPLVGHALLLPLAVVTNLGLRLPGVAPSAVAANAGLAQIGQFLQFFWFAQFPVPLLALLVGGVAVGLPLRRVGRALALRLRQAAILSDKEQT